ncbi:glycoside hydrolase family 2 TIM barrel-domain containing protein [Paraglaciecola aquimarina]|uniref:Glycoside hydrolase family 2 TIM barrel-domain containing protein n=1 Tax=Paraglaciecola aquimarina TaxID=1235557 RepID=A0ABU3SV98_9ALTE|nr:glycoside hydrolase family 2 TIM barrel-domain containing protein [Paraglaciecola aquimarina]MDU0353941.1 glycoside hydrolase family 2 TIM barrel-domain containing protein [Paraglaciecola aquimarina]
MIKRKLRSCLALVLITTFMASCNMQQQSIPTVDEETISLNGDWKFYAIYGEGSNYMNIQEQSSDLVIDNKDANVEMKGKWKSSTLGQRNTQIYGDDYVQHNFTLTDLNNANKEDDSYFRFYPKFQKSGYYEAFTRYPFASHLTAQYKIKHADGLAAKYVSQRVFCNEWNSLGIFKFDSQQQNYVELTAIVSGTVAADAVMFREISEEKYLQAKQQPNRVYLSEFDDANWADLKVPGHWGMNNDFSNYTGKAWYRKHINLPKSWQKSSDQRYYLKFAGVYHLASVYLNGTLIGKNRGGFTPFEFDVTDALNFAGDNVIAVQADNSAVVGATWNWGGIIRDVTLTKNNDVRIDYQYVHADPDLETGSANIKLRVKVENNANVERNIQLTSNILDGKQIATLSGSIDVPANSSKEIHLDTQLSPEQVKLWHFDNPKLYQIETSISDDSKVLHTKQENFGIRKVELTTSKMLLNGEPVRLAGFNRVSEHRYWGSSEPAEILAQDIDLMKEAGANFMRIMHGTQNKTLFELADKKGLLLFEEINVRDLDNDEFRANYYPVAKLEQEKGIKLNLADEEILTLDEAYVKLRPEHGVTVTEKNYFLAKYWLKGMIERDINHPSIIGWSVGNELNNHYEYGKAAIDYVKTELDPYRLLTVVSNSGQKPQYTPETDPNTFSDIIMHNMYRWQGEPQEILNTLRAKWPDKPVFISEFGFDPFPSTALDADKEIFSEWTNHFRHKNEFVIGTSMWTFNDYRSAYAGTTAEENRVWGVITSWREKRRLYQRIQKEYAPVKDIEVSNIDFNNNQAQVRMPIRDPGDYPSHSMHNYQLRYQFSNSQGQVVYSNVKNLPSITPLDKEWQGTISWTSLPDDVLALSLSLVTPTKHTRLSKTVSFQPAITPQISTLLSGKNAIRILFDKVPNATEYFVRYTDEKGLTHTSDKTISDRIDITGLQANQDYQFRLFAINDKGPSQASKPITASTNTKALPPIIWDSFIVDNKLVIAYSSDFADGNYVVQYGSGKEQLNKTFVSNVRGMLSIDLSGEKQIYFKIKRQLNSQDSNWSETVKVE